MTLGDVNDIPALFASESAKRLNKAPNAYSRTRAAIAEILSEDPKSSKGVHVNYYRNLGRLANPEVSFVVLEWKLGDDRLSTTDTAFHEQDKVAREAAARERILTEAENTTLKAAVVAFKDPLSNGGAEHRIVALGHRAGAYPAASIETLAKRLGLRPDQITTWPAAAKGKAPVAPLPGSGPTDPTGGFSAAWKPRASVHLNLVLEGVPGTGKTYWMKRNLKRAFTPDGTDIGSLGDGPYAITLHPATSYEDFVEGLRPGHAVPTLAGGVVVVNRKHIDVANSDPDDSWFFCSSTTQGPRQGSPGGQDVYLDAEPLAGRPAVSFCVHDGFFLRACAHAVAHPDKGFVVLLDEFNRCNLPKVLGDLLTTLESSKRAVWDAVHGWNTTHSQVVTLPYSGRKFFVPANVVVVATMNTTDRSVTGLDGALRRRFAFERLWPLGFNNEDRVFSMDELASELQLVDLDEPGESVVPGAVLDASPPAAQEASPSAPAGADPFEGSMWAWGRLNESLLREFGPDGQLGHSYLFDMQRALMRDGRYWSADADADTLREHWNKFLLPQLVEVFENGNATSAMNFETSPLLKTLRDDLMSVGTLQMHQSGKNVLLRRISLLLWPRKP